MEKKHTYPKEGEEWARYMTCSVAEFMAMLERWESGEEERPDTPVVARNGGGGLKVSPGKLPFYANSRYTD